MQDHFDYSVFILTYIHNDFEEILDNYFRRICIFKSAQKFQITSQNEEILPT
jgi:hypothetical protein